MTQELRISIINLRLSFNINIALVLNWFTGIAYLLRIFSLNEQFDSLKWFQSVSENYDEKLRLLKTQEIKALKSDAKLQQPLSLSYSRLQVYYKVNMIF